MMNETSGRSYLQSYRIFTLVLLLSTGVWSGCEGLLTSSKEEEDEQLLDGPTNVVVKYIDGKLVVSWDPVDHAQSYTVYWKEHDGNDLDPADNATQSVPNSSSPYTFTFPSYHVGGRVTAYQFALSATVNDKETRLSAGVVGGVYNGTLRAEGVDKAVQILLDGGCACAQEHSWMKIWWDTKPVNVGDGTHVSVPFHETPFQHTGLTPGTTYYYAVVLTNEYGSTEVFKLSATPFDASQPQ